MKEINPNKIPFFATCQQALLEDSPSNKAKIVFHLFRFLNKDEVYFEKGFKPEQACRAGRPALPALVPPQECSPRSPKSLEGRMSLVHALAHIEFNAINLALDACVRFHGMPNMYYRDWIKVARDEAYHFQLLRTHLRAHDKDYGDYAAHNGLWEMAEKTSHDVLARMGCVPRIMEARGLDVSPGIAKKLIEHNDDNGATLLEIIMRDEVRHVEIGNKWFNKLCAERGLDPLTTFQSLIAEYAPGIIRPPMAKESRLKAGFTKDELSWLEAVMHQPKQDSPI